MGNAIPDPILSSIILFLTHTLSLSLSALLPLAALCLVPDFSILPRTSENLAAPLVLRLHRSTPATPSRYSLHARTRRDHPKRDRLSHVAWNSATFQTPHLPPLYTVIWCRSKLQCCIHNASRTGFMCIYSRDHEKRLDSCTLLHCLSVQWFSISFSPYHCGNCKIYNLYFTLKKGNSSVAFVDI